MRFCDGLRLLFFFISACSVSDNSHNPETKPDMGKLSVPGQSLPGSWRPFNDDSPWNTSIGSDARVHPMSEAIIGRMRGAAETIRFGNYYIIPLWVVNADEMNLFKAKAAYPFDIWDPDNDSITDIGVPIDTSMWGEQTEDGHIIVMDTLYDLSWEMSRYKGIKNGMINCSTFNVWDLNGKGAGDPDEGMRWKARGGRGSGFPNIAGLIRPEEIQAGKIRHALAFTFETNKKDEFYYPASRTDGRFDFPDAPAEGMLFQLNPALTDENFREWGLSPAATIVARALQEYGMYLCDNGGNMALQLQLLDKRTEVNRMKWDTLAPGLYSTVTKIPTHEFRVMDTGPPLTGGAATRITAPLIVPQCGSFQGQVKVTMVTNAHWTDATIRYTLDGSIPTESSLLYREPFVLTSSSTVKARAFHPDAKASHVMRAPFIIK